MNYKQYYTLRFNGTLSTARKHSKTEASYASAVTIMVEMSVRLSFTRWYCVKYSQNDLGGSRGLH